MGAGSNVVTTYPYHDADGNLSYAIRRFERPGLCGELPNKTFCIYTLRADGMWVEALEASRVLYRLPAIEMAPPDAPIFVCEGEKAADAAQVALENSGSAAVATTTVGGAKSSQLTPLEALRGRNVIILPDADEDGETYATTIVHQAREAGAAQVAILRLNGLPPKGDIVEWLAAGHDGHELLRLAGEALSATASRGDPDVDIVLAEASAPEGRGPSIAALLAAIGERDADLWHDADGETYATFPVGAHFETAKLKARTFRRWLAARLYTATRKQPNSQALQDALLTLDGLAANERPERLVAVRMAKSPTNPDVIYLDLADIEWRVIEITPCGWRLLSSAETATLPVRFRRPHGMAPLPLPIPNGAAADHDALSTLRAFVNVRDERDWRLIATWLIAAFSPTGPYPVLNLSGEQGSAKTTLARILRALVDPNVAAIRRAPRDERDLMIAATNAHVITLDNLSNMPTWLSDALCVLSTGGGFATRALYENNEEAIFTAQRPVIMTGIEDVATRGDLIDRALCITLAPIPDAQRRTEAELWAAFEEARPAIVGALLGVVAGALEARLHVQLTDPPRMADFAAWALAAEGALGWPEGSFLAAYQSNRASANDLALDVSPLAGAVLALLGDATRAPGGVWKGTAAELLATLSEIGGDRVAKSSGWPQSPRGLTGALTRIAPYLRRAGITIETGLRSADRSRARYTVLTRGSPPDSNKSEEDEEREQRRTPPSTPSTPSTPSSLAALQSANTEL